MIVLLKFTTSWDKYAVLVFTMHSDFTDRLNLNFSLRESLGTTTKYGDGRLWKLEDNSSQKTSQKQ